MKRSGVQRSEDDGKERVRSGEEAAESETGINPRVIWEIYAQYNESTATRGFLFFFRVKKVQIRVPHRRRLRGRGVLLLLLLLHLVILFPFASRNGRTRLFVTVGNTS